MTFIKTSGKIKIYGDTSVILCKRRTCSRSQTGCLLETRTWSLILTTLEYHSTDSSENTVIYS